MDGAIPAGGVVSTAAPATRQRATIVNPESQIPPAPGGRTAARFHAGALVAPLVFLAASAPYWATRLLYDDELTTVTVSLRQGVSAIWKHISSTDVHPPGHYVYAHGFLALFPSPESAAVASGLVASAASLVVLWRLLVLRLSWTPGRATIAAVLSALHPALVLHGSALRWYPLWTLLALLFVDRLFAWNEKPTAPRALAMLVPAAAMFFVNYMTAWLLAAAGGWLVLEALLAPERAHWVRARARSGMLFAAGFLLVAWSYRDALRIHLANAGTQSGGSRVLSIANNVYSTLLGQSIGPWEYLVVAPFVLALLALVALGFRELRSSPFLRFVTIAFVVLVALTALTSFNKSRSFLFWAVLAGPAVVALAGADRRRWALAGVLACTWAYGDVNVALRRSLHKAGLADPIAEVVAHVRGTGPAAAGTLAVSPNPVLTYYLFRAGVPVCSVLDLTAAGGPEKGCPATEGVGEVVLVDTPLGSLEPLRPKYDGMTAALAGWTGTGLGPAVRLGEDPDFEKKRALAGAGNVARWRFELYRLRGSGPWPADDVRAFFTSPLPWETRARR